MRTEEQKRMHASYQRQWRANNPEKVREINRRYRENNKEKIAEWKKMHPESVNEHKRRWEINNAEKHRAHRTIDNKVNSGRMNKPTHCECCGNGPCITQGHHEDYSKPLDVLWLCDICHRKTHGRLEA